MGVELQLHSFFSPTLLEREFSAVQDIQQAKRLKYVSNWRLGGSQGRPERFGGKKSSESSIDQTIVLVAMATALSGPRGGRETLICTKYGIESTFFHLVDTDLLVKKASFCLPELATYFDFRLMPRISLNKPPTFSKSVNNKESIDQ